MEEMYILKELSKFDHITFFDCNHTYNSSKYGFLISVTTALKKFQKPFDEHYWLVYKTLERQGNKPNLTNFNPYEYNIDTSEIKSEWDKAKLIGTTTGSQCHNYLENLWLGKVFEEDYTERFHKLKYQLDNFVKDTKDILISIRLEQVVGNEYLAGQIDGLFWNRKTNSIWLIDYKTDKKLSRTNKYQKFLKPLDSLEDCSFNKYMLQTNLYKYILETETNLKIDKIVIIWFNVNNKNYQTIKIPNYNVHNITNYIKDKNFN